MVLEVEFEKEVSKKKLSDAQLIALVKAYKKKIEESGFAQNTRFTKMSRINIVVKRLYPHLYSEVLKFNIPDRAEKKAQIQERNEFNMQRLQDRQEFTFDEIMDAINTLKTSQDYYKLVVCVLLSTGRRSTEVIARGNFEPSDTAHHVFFSGQLKTGDEKREAYDIPVIGLTPQTLIRLVAKIRGMKYYSNETNAFIASRTNAYVNRAISTALDKPDRHVTSETIRCIYAYIAYRLYGNPRISEAVYCSNILGHIGTPHTLVDNYNRVFVSGNKYDGEEMDDTKETIDDLRRKMAEKDVEIASLKQQIAYLKTQMKRLQK
jgi:hypothetical protein